MTETEYTDTQGRVWRRVSSGGSVYSVFAPASVGTIPPDVVAWLRSQHPDTNDEPSTADICAALHAATTDSTLAEAWLGSRRSRWSKPLADRVQIIESWIDAQSNIGDDCK